MLMRVTAPPADGAANQAVIKTLSDALSLPRGQVEIVRGLRSRQKQVRFEIPSDELDRRLASLIR